MNIEYQKVHISTIKQGDVILHNGELITVSRDYIKRDPFMGLTLYGDSYNLGNKPVIKVIIKRML